MHMAVERRKHHVHELYIAIFKKVVAGYHMPTTVPIMAFTTFSDIHGCFNFKPFASPAFGIRIEVVRIALIMVVLVGGEQ